MMPLVRRRLPLIALTALLWAAWAQAQESGLDQNAERQRLQNERAAIEQRGAAERAQCYQQFVVNSCLTDVRRREREDLAGVKRQEHVLNTLERQRKASEQLRKTEERSSLPRQEAAAADRERRVGERQERDARAVSKPQDKPAPIARKPAQPASKPSPAAKAQASSANRAVFDQKQKDAAAHLADVEKRRKERSTPLAAPLPAPFPVAPSSR